MDRELIIIKTSIIGIIANLFLSLFKIVVGLTSNSIAIVMDAINNLTDALSSIVTIVGIKLANKKSDRQHPFGHGRIEYLSAMLISIIIIYAGITSFIESIKKIINPDTPDYSIVSLFIIFVAILVKIFLGNYVKKIGEKVKSDSLIASGSDAKFDAIISLSTLLAGIIYLLFNISIESFLGTIISLIIIKSGYELLTGTVNELLGSRIDSELAKNIKNAINSFDDVKGTYDLILHNYGPNVLVGSAHIEVLDTMTAYEIDTLEREISKKIFNEFKIYITGLSIYSSNTKNKKVKEMTNNIDQILSEFKTVIQMHGFYLDEDKRIIKFDIVISFEEKNKNLIVSDIKNKINNIYSDYEIQITIDNDISD